LVAARVREFGMRKDREKPEWTRPQLKRLGRIEDVAGAQTPLAQAMGNVKS
jgi:hypothetical protein